MGADIRWREAISASITASQFWWVEIGDLSVISRALQKLLMVLLHAIC